MSARTILNPPLINELSGLFDGTSSPEVLSLTASGDISGSTITGAELIVSSEFGNVDITSTPSGLSVSSGLTVSVGNITAPAGNISCATGTMSAQTITVNNNITITSTGTIQFGGPGAVLSIDAQGQLLWNGAVITTA
jgi:hypothetical protein